MRRFWRHLWNRLRHRLRHWRCDPRLCKGQQQHCCERHGNTRRKSERFLGIWLAVSLRCFHDRRGCFMLFLNLSFRVFTGQKTCHFLESWLQSVLLRDLKHTKWTWNRNCKASENHRGAGLLDVVTCRVDFENTSRLAEGLEHSQHQCGWFFAYLWSVQWTIKIDQV